MTIEQAESLVRLLIDRLRSVGNVEDAEAVETILQQKVQKEATLMLEDRDHG